MVDRVPSFNLLQSGLSLFHVSGNLADAAGRKLSTGSSDDILDGMAGLQEARRSAKIAGVMVRVSQEIDDSLLDILA